MRVFMLGWEFPPFISGGLGTACHGLTRALSRADVDVTFVIPKAIGGEYQSSHVRLLAPQADEPQTEVSGGPRSPEAVASTYALDRDETPDLENVTFKAVPSRLINPYQQVAPDGTVIDMGPTGAAPGGAPIGVLGMGASGGHADGGTGGEGPQWVPGAGLHYGGDLIAETARYARLCVDLARGETFDVIHAHDWLTYPAGLAVAALTGKPLVVHVHSTEFDRAGENGNSAVSDIERRGMRGAMKVVCVSYLTKRIVEHRYGIDASKVQVVYNGIENGPMGNEPTPASRATIRRGDKVVLFLGRITMQKGPEYFVRAAKKVLSVTDNVKFVMAGSGDMVKDVIDLAAREGIGHKVLFTGFLRGRDVERVFKMADVYVMPSVSEPFGIAPLEAISHDVPVIISKTSGVAEVLEHALKVDFWDVDEMANKIVAVLRHPPLSTTLREHADLEVRNLTWDGAAERCVKVYQEAVDTMPG